MAAASLVLGLAGFGNGLVAMAFLPYFMPSATAIAVLMIYTIVLAVAIFVPVRRHLAPRGGAYLLEPGRDPGRLLVGEGLDG